MDSSSAIVGASSLSVTSLVLHLVRFLSSGPAPPPFLDPCPVCLAVSFTSGHWVLEDLHLPSVLLGVGIGLLLLPLLELLLAVRILILNRVAPGQRPFLYRLV